MFAKTIMIDSFSKQLLILLPLSFEYSKTFDEFSLSPRFRAIYRDIFPLHAID